MFALSVMFLEFTILLILLISTIDTRTIFNDDEDDSTVNEEFWTNECATPIRLRAGHRWQYLVGESQRVLEQFSDAERIIEQLSEHLLAHLDQEDVEQLNSTSTTTGLEINRQQTVSDIANLNSVYEALIRASVFAEQMLANQEEQANSHAHTNMDVETATILDLLQYGGVHERRIYSGGLRILICKLESQLTQVDDGFLPVSRSGAPTLPIRRNTVDRRHQNFVITRDLKRLLRNKKTLLQDIFS